MTRLAMRQNKITGANTGGRQISMRTRWAARAAQFCRSAFLCERAVPGWQALR
jgi:hypothetical protein